MLNVIQQMKFNLNSNYQHKLLRHKLSRLKKWKCKFVIGDWSMKWERFSEALITAPDPTQLKLTDQTVVSPGWSFHPTQLKSAKISLSCQLLSLGCFHSVVVTRLLSLTCCHSDVVSQLLSLGCCHSVVVTRLLSLGCCHSVVVTRLLSLGCCCHSVVVTRLSLSCCHCCHSVVVTRLLSLGCCCHSVVVSLWWWYGNSKELANFEYDRHR